MYRPRSLCFPQIGKATIRLDVQIDNWPFCTAFGRGGGQVCRAAEQDIFLELPGALPDPPTPPPPHTLLIPLCEGDAVATLRFVCDPTLPMCNDITSVKFYLVDADQPPNRAPNVATIDANTTDDAAALEEARGTGRYEHNLTRTELGDFLNVTDLIPGQDYVFWSVWGHETGLAPEFNSRDFDFSRSQYW